MVAPKQTSAIRQLLYWSIYTVEKCLCLKIGPASGMHEYNITLEPHFQFNGFGAPAPLALSASWIHLAMLEGRIYTELFVTPCISPRWRLLLSDEQVQSGSMQVPVAGDVATR